MSAFMNNLRAFYKVNALIGRTRPEIKTMRRHRDAFYAEVWRETAAELDAATVDLGDNIFEITLHGRRVRVSRNLSPLDDALTLRLAGNKPIVYRLLEQAGIQIPRHLVFGLDRFDEARRFARTLGGPVVVKPASGTGAGAGVCTGVSGTMPLVHAMARAAAFSPQVVIEEQVAGDNIRLLYLDGELLDCVVRYPPTVTGDGRSTIRALIDAENRLRLQQGAARGQVLLSIDRDLRNTLAEQGLSIRSRPKSGQTVILKRVINDNRGDENEAGMARLSPELIDVGRRVVETVDVRLAGVDFILSPGGAVVIDVNTTPGFYYHYRRRGEPARVALPILRRALGLN